MEKDEKMLPKGGQNESQNQWKNIKKQVNNREPKIMRPHTGAKTGQKSIQDEVRKCIRHAIGTQKDHAFSRACKLVIGEA